MPAVKPSSCTGCPLVDKGIGFTEIDGLGQLGVMIVGEASGEHESRDSLPFRSYAPAGSLLERVIRNLRYERNQFSITNVLRCRPPKDFLDGAPYEHEAIEHCRPNLSEAIGKKQPKAILALGNIPLRTLTGMVGKNQSIGYLRGYVLPSRIPTKQPCECVKNGLPEKNCFICGEKGLDDSYLPGPPVIASYHPSFLRRGATSLMGVLAIDIRKAIHLAQNGFQQHPVEYQGRPSLDDAWSFYYKAKDRAANGLLTYDIETPNSSDMPEDERDDDPSYEIISTQFSLDPYTGIFLRHKKEFRPVIEALLALPIMKAGQNVWNYDDPRLKANGYQINGLVHDTMNMWHHVQPDLPAHLQFAASFYGMDFPWKHLNISDAEFYGCADVDAPQRMMQKLPDDLKARGVWDSYMRQVVGLHPVLVKAQDHGLPINNKARLEMKTELEIVKAETLLKIRPAVPDACKRLDPKKGYKGIPPKLKEILAAGEQPPYQGIELKKNKKGDVKEHPFEYVQMDFSGEQRWIKKFEFNPGSWQQLIGYMKAKGHPVPKDLKTDDETTAKKELERLAKKTNDNFYLNILEYRQTDKMLGTYVNGFAPAADGRVHTTFTFQTGTGQLTSRRPNVQNIPKHSKLAKAFRRMIEAPPGYRIVELDFSSFHVLTLGFEAQDPDYMRAARLDMHSLVSGHVLKVWDARRILELPDEEVVERCNWYKSNPTYKFHRDKKSKPSILGIGFGLGVIKLYDMNRESFENISEAKGVRGVIEGLFPRVFKFQDEIKQTAHNQTFLLSKFGFIRWFWEVFRFDSRQRKYVSGEDAEAAIAFLPANDAHGVIRETLLECDRLGYVDRYGFMNTIHDSLVFLTKWEMLDEMTHNVHAVMARPSPELTNPVAPNGLACGVSVSIGRNWAAMEDIKLGALIR